MNNAYIFDGLRTALGRAKRGDKKGVFSDIHPVDLASPLVSELINRNNLSPTNIEDVIFGCAAPCGEQGFNIGRLISVKALGEDVPGTQENRLCGSGMEAVRNAACHVVTNDNDLIIAGGVESMSRVPMGADMMPPLAGMPMDMIKTLLRVFKLKERIVLETLPKGYSFTPMGISGDLIAKKYKLTRHDLDSFAVSSHEKAALATKSGRYLKEIFPIETAKGKITQDEGIRSNTTIERLAELSPAFGKKGFHTAGTSSQITDGAAAFLIGNDNAIKKYGLKPRAKILKTVVVGSDLRYQLTGPIKAISSILEKTGLKISDIDLFEINEAFASVVLATQKEHNIPLEKININGGAIALGHPLGASGARLLVTLLHELEEKELKLGLAVLCIGGGQAIASIIERT